MSENERPPRPERDEGLAVRERPKTQKPRLYKVLLHNDDFTTQEFVVHLLMEVFRKDFTEATAIMLHVHTKGVGVAGVYTRDVAETKLEVATKLAREAGMPLQLTLEAE
ncbi:MAG: ATP-dependent Clp protease adaptor ClpS [Deltaproteobacteria bacterium]|jgi:ATP-dependent Clp protease adaptor protein ClpS|nr:ATP-dependent Clp protease adaptor ClpS [Deltaproteobacteria bacterium]